LDPVAYGFEAAMVNEFSGRTFDCSNVVPSGPTYTALAAANQVCNAVGAVPGSNIVSGEAYLNSAYGYEASHKWRNIGILIAFMFGLLGWHLLTTGTKYPEPQCRWLTSAEYITAAQSKGEVLLFPRGQVPDTSDIKEDIESQGSKSRIKEKSSNAPGKSEAAIIERQTAIFSWKDVVYDIKIKNEPRRILDHVDGWVKPGTLTALMVSRVDFLLISVNIGRVYLVLEKPLFSTSSLPALPWELSLVGCSSTVTRGTSRFKERLGMSNNKIYTFPRAPFGRLFASARCSDSHDMCRWRKNTNTLKRSYDYSKWNPTVMRWLAYPAKVSTWSSEND